MNRTTVELERELLLARRALRWALSEGARAFGVASVMDSGCGCCSSELEIPIDFAHEVIAATATLATMEEEKERERKAALAVVPKGEKSNKYTTTFMRYLTDDKGGPA